MNPETSILTDALRPFVDRKVLPGAVVLVADQSSVLALETIGVADLATGMPMQHDTMFWIASMTKPMTATALMMLVDAGRVDVDEPVENYLPEFKNIWLIVEGDDQRQILRRPASPLRVRHLLGHTSGMPYRAPMEFVAQDILSLAAAVRLYVLTPLATEPGAKFAYGNPAINTVGRIIEVVSGMPYETFMQTRLFEPLGMTNTTFWPDELQVARLARTYKPNADNSALEPAENAYCIAPLSDRKRQPFPGGGLFSTAPDVGRFAQMILAGGAVKGRRYVSPQTLARFTRQQQGECLDGNYGLGFQIFGETFGHGGAFNTNMTIDPKRGIATVYLVQLSGTLGDAGAAHPAFRRAAEENFRK